MVEGRPAPQGSKNAYVRGGRPIMVEASKYLPEWREAVKLAAKLAMHDQLDYSAFTRPVRLEVSFFIELYPGSKPDLDHLIRAVGDSLTQAGVLADDSLIVEVFAKKLWTGSTTDTYPKPGARVEVSLI
jgi:Holliday junction resolvase RusA-like endonuclease